jgi:hypothetical protein
MIREPSNMDNLTINVMLRDGTKFHGMDVTSNPFGQHERVVSFWFGDVIRMYPMSEVEFVELVPGAA